RNPEFQYYRVTEAPRNPVNKADAFHLGMIEHFKANPQQEWHGISQKDGAHTFYIIVPVYVKAECLKCHGVPEDAPPGLIKIYGKESGFAYREGQLMGVESIAISLSPAMEQIGDLAMQIFSIGFLGMFLLFIAIDGTFLRLIGKPLRRMAMRFESIASGNTSLAKELPIHAMDEIGEMTSAFNTMAHHLAEAQKTLQTNAEILQSIVDGISDPLALVNDDGSLTVINHAYQVWIAKSCPAVLGCGSEGRGEGGGHAPESMLQKVFETGKPVNGEWTAPNERCYFMNFYPVFNESGRVSQVVHYVRDITAEKRAESQMMHMEKMAAIGQLSAGVAHEINNPMGIIRCYAKLLERDLPADHPAVDDVRVIERNAEACTQIIDGLLSFARHGATRKEKGRLDDCLSSVKAMVEKQFSQEGIRLQTDSDGRTPEFFFDPERIKQVFMNLLMNARQAMPQKGSIAITTSYHPERRCVEIRVRDTGAGISPENLDRIFDPFFTTKQPGRGTGLGLSVSFGIVKEHGGEISVESTPGVGSTFIVNLPVDAYDEEFH
ncbi:MAG: DUF3365 domain-containing protein, partial [Desulfobacteraceae bacterium]|nr:DUF3365 domain-containing protein [Desulfobacteraceae bacterium]